MNEMILHWNKNGEPIRDALEWARLFEDFAYRLVAIHKDDDVEVITVWTGINQDGDVNGRAIFSTGVFKGGTAREMIHEQFWNTLDEARSGHDELAARHW